MKTSRVNFWVLLILSSVFIFSCDSDSNDPDPQSTQTNVLPSTPSDANAVLASIKVKSNVPGTVPVPGIPDILIDVASASFFSGAGSGSLVSVGDVTLNSNKLQNIGGNAYVNNSTEFMLNLNPGQTNSWVVVGGNGFPAINHTTSKRMPGVVRLSNVAEEISRSGSVTLAIESVPSNTDNILWVISDGTTVATKESKATSVTFTTTELGGLKATATGIVQAAAYTTESGTFGGKKIYFINETLDSKFVKIN